MIIEVPDALVEMGRKMLSQDNEFTSHPIFVVKKMVRRFGFDTTYSEDTITWINADGNEADEKIIINLNKEYENSYSDCINGYTRTGYQDHWEPIASFFTKEAADKLVAGKRRNEFRVYVDSAHRNHECRMIRDFLMSLPRQENGNTPDAGNVPLEALSQGCQFVPRLITEEQINNALREGALNAISAGKR
jgi:hypothetical protein